jgi:acetyltransferase
MVEITRLSNYNEAQNAFPELVDLLIDAVEGGASVGFLLPIDRAEIEAYWRKVLDTLNDRVLLVAHENGKIVGSVQLALESRANGIHRAEVQKLLVHRTARRQGLATKLMERVESAARGENRTLLVLDTAKGHSAEPLYLKLGYTIAGVIPDYAISPNRDTIDATVVMYKVLNSTSE